MLDHSVDAKRSRSFGAGDVQLSIDAADRAQAAASGRCRAIAGKQHTSSMLLYRCQSMGQTGALTDTRPLHRRFPLEAVSVRNVELSLSQFEKHFSNISWS